MSFLSTEFSEFINSSCNRFEYLKKWLVKSAIPFSIVPIDQKQHIYINFSKSAYSPLFKTKTLLIHYDRAENTPGANDNSAAIYQVISFIKRLQTQSKPHNMRIFFTDGEEMINGETVQGAFGLAKMFKKLGILDDDVFVIDSCGRGDVLVVSTAGKNSPASYNFNKKFNELFERTCSLVSVTSPEKWMSIPVPYSDNAGFLSCGIPAIAVTVLPKDELTVYIRQLQKDSKFAELVMSHKVTQQIKDKAEALLLEEKLPKTWRIMHTPLDDEGSLTPESFKLMEKFLDNLASLLILA